MDRGEGIVERVLEIQVENVETEKAIAIWINSSLGILTLLAQRTSTMGGWVAMKKTDLRNLRSSIHVD